MEYDVFVSHASEDSAVAEAIVEHFEAEGLTCWIAPRDIDAGLTWAGAIVHGVNASRLMVLVFSSHTQESDYVMNELGLALGNKIPMIPFRIEEVEPEGDFKFYLSSRHWFDAWRSEPQSYIAKLLDIVQGTLGIVPSDTRKPVSQDKVEEQISHEPKAPEALIADIQSELPKETFTTEILPDNEPKKESKESHSGTETKPIDAPAIQTDEPSQKESEISSPASKNRKGIIIGSILLLVLSIGITIILQSRPSKIKEVSRKWITPSSGACSAKGGTFSSGHCIANWEQALSICQDIGARTPTIQNFYDWITIECGGKIGEKTNIDNKKFRTCYKEQGFNKDFNYWSSTEVPEIDHGSGAWSLNIYFADGAWDKKLNTNHVICFKK